MGVRVSEGITKFIEEKLKLKVNQAKTSVGNISNMKYLGFSFYIASKRTYRIRIHPKSVKKMHDKIRHIMKRSNGHGYKRIKEELVKFIRGWVNYFKIADIKDLLTKTDKWLRHKIRCYIWKCWKKTKKKRKELVSLGQSAEKARMLAGSREGLWKVSQYQDMSIAITNEKLSRAGYPTFTQYHL